MVKLRKSRVRPLFTATPLCPACQGLGRAFVPAYGRIVAEFAPCEACGGSGQRVDVRRVAK